MGSRHSDFSKSFKLAIRSLLSSCSKEEFCRAFSKFNSAEQETLYYLFIQVITSLHKMIEDCKNLNVYCFWSKVSVIKEKNLEDEFESLGLEIQVATTLDTVDQLVEEQRLDPLFLEKTNVIDVANNLTTEKKNEIRCLMGMLERAEEQNRLFQARIELLKKGKHDVSATDDVELRSMILNYWTSSKGV